MAVVTVGRLAAASMATALALGGCTSSDVRESPEKPVSPLRSPIGFTRTLSGEDQPILYRIDPGGTDEQRIRPINEVTLSPDGRTFMDVAVAPDGRLTTATFDVDGSNYHVLPIPDPTLQIAAGSWSPDGSRFASEAWDDEDPDRIGIYSRRSSDGGGLIRLTDAGTRRDFPASHAFSADGKKVLFFRPNEEGETSDRALLELFVVDADGDNLRRLSPPGTNSAFIWAGSTAGWSPDGAEVAFVVSRGSFWENRTRSVYVVEADGSGLHRIGPRGDIYDASWSPDGQWIAFTMTPPSNSDWAPQLYVMHPDGSGVVQLAFETDSFWLGPKWSPDSSQLLIVRGTGEDENVTDVWSVDVDGSNLYQVTHEPAGYGAFWFTPAAV
jgi:Tol biopolymer transport system component